MIPEAKLGRVLDRFHAIEAQLSSSHTGDFVKLSKEHAQLSPVVNAVRAYSDTRKALVDHIVELCEKKAAEIEADRNALEPAQ